jgi:myo-inositol-1-phosphate synthase
MTESVNIAPATGRLGVLTPGMGAVSSTFMAGVLATRAGTAVPVGSLSQLAHIRLGKREENRNPKINEFVPLADLGDLVFGGWDPISPNALEAARTCGVLEEKDLGPISAELEGIVAMDAVFDQRWVKRLDGTRVKTITDKWAQAEALIADIENFRTENECDRLVMVWCGSTEAYQEASAVHMTIEAFEAGLKAGNPGAKATTVFTGSFEDVAGAKAAALALIDQGNDFLFHNANAAALGVFNAATERGVWAFGANKDQNSLAPSVLASAVIDLPRAFVEAAR